MSFFGSNTKTSSLLLLIFRHILGSQERDRAMGCAASKQGGCGCGENRPKELGICAAVSTDVRWSWLRGRTLFTFAELRALLKLYRAATSSTQLGGGAVVNDNNDGGTSITAVSNNISNNNRKDVARYAAPAITTAPSFSTTEAGSCTSEGGCAGEVVGAMTKERFLAVCKSDDAPFRLSEVVGGFGSRLFDIFSDGNGILDFEDFALGMSKLLKVGERVV